MLISNISKRYQRFVFTVILVVLLAAIQPLLWSYVRRSANVYYLKRVEGQQLLETRKRNEVIKKRVADMQQYVDQLSVVVPPRSFLTQVVERLELLADQQKLKFSIVNIVEGAPPKGSKEDQQAIVPVTISIEVQGFSMAALDYLGKIEHLPEATWIRNWSLTPITNQLIVTGPQHKLTMDIVIYMQNKSDDIR